MAAASASVPLPKVLFVCMGNICRSPAAEGVMRHKIAAAGLGDQIQVDSAGTGGWHAGNRADQRMRAAALARGYDLTSIARQVRPEDFADFDLVLIMDEQNRRDLRVFDPQGTHAAKVRFFCEFCTEHEAKEVPDPYYGGADGFETVLNLLEDGCANLVEYLRKGL